MKRTRKEPKSKRPTKRVRKDGVPAVLFANRRAGATELKVVDIAETTSTLGNAGAFVAINILSEGTGFNNRIGRRVRMKSLHFRGQITIGGGNAAAIVSPLRARIMLVYDRQANGALPALADLIQAVTQAGAASNNTFDGLNMNNRERFKVLMDNQIVLSPIGINGATPANNVSMAAGVANSTESNMPQGQLNINRFIKLMGLEAHFKSNNGNITDLATGSIFAFFLANDSNASPAYDCTWSARLKFFD